MHRVAAPLNPAGHARSWYTATATAFASCLFFPDLQRTAVKGFAIQCRHGGPCFVALHFNESKAFAFAAENVRDEHKRTDGAVL